MARIKGTNLSHVRDFVVKELGEDALARLIAALPPASRGSFESFALTGWYPMEVYLDAVHAMDGVLGKGDGDLLRRGAAFAADYDITRIHRLLFRLANPAFVLEKSMDIWHRFFDTGAWTIKRPTHNSADGVLDGWVTDAPACEYLRAYLVNMFLLAGAKDAGVRHIECRARASAHCRFLITWT